MFGKHATSGRSNFESAIFDDDGEVNVGYYALGWGLRGWGLGCVVILAIGVASAWRAPTDAAAIIQATGIAVGAISIAYGTMLGAVGFFLMGDKRALPVPGSTKTVLSSRETITKGPVPGATDTDEEPTKVSVVNMPAKDAPPARKKR